MTPCSISYTVATYTERSKHAVTFFHQPQDTDMSVFYCKEIREINVNGVEGKSWELEQKIRYDPKTTFRLSKTGQTDESWADVFMRVSNFLDGLIQKFVDEKDKSGITESNYIEINSKPNEEYLSQKDVKEMHDKGVYLLKI